MLTWRRFRLGLVSAILLACLQGCSAREVGGDALEGMMTRFLAWWSTQGRVMVKEEATSAAVAVGNAVKDEAIKASAELTDKKLREMDDRLAQAGVDSKKIDSLAAVIAGWKQIQEKEKESGKPYTGNALLDLMMAYLATKYGAQFAVNKLKKPAPPQPAP